MTLRYLFFTVTWAFFSFFSANAQLHNAQYTKADSLKVVNLLSQASKQGSMESGGLMVYFGLKLCGLPYVAKTLETNPKERLVVNLRQLDCTTFVENTLALTLCMKHGKLRFADFCHFLRMIRYRQGEVAYTKRLHYFTQWIDDNTELGYVSEVTSAKSPFTAIQNLSIDYMTTHVPQYPMLEGDKQAIAEIGKCENALTGRKFRYIPKAEIRNNDLFRNTIHNGDIIAILTSKKGLDTSHIGIAFWKADGLHLLNASSLHHKVVLEPKLLRTYMMGQKSQTGIRVIRVK